MALPHGHNECNWCGQSHPCPNLQARELLTKIAESALELARGDGQTEFPRSPLWDLVRSWDRLRIAEMGRALKFDEASALLKHQHGCPTPGALEHDVRAGRLTCAGCGNSVSTK